MVSVPELEIRAEPSLAGERLDSLRRGMVFALGGFGPVEADGLTWYEVIRMCAGGPDGAPDPLGSLGRADAPCSHQPWGWLPVAGADGPLVEPTEARCPTVPDLASLAGILPGERFECWAGEPLELSGSYRNGCCLIGPPREFDPEWLVGPIDGPHLLWDLDATGLTYIEIRFPPEVEPPAIGPEDMVGLRVSGRFDDPRAPSCSIEFDGRVVPQLQATMFCRQQFVVESYAILALAS